MKRFVWPLTLLSLSPVLVLAKPVSYQQDIAGKQLKLQLEGVSQKAVSYTHLTLPTTPYV